jgi:hypothetical protein
MKGYLRRNGNASYLDVELQEALDALAAHVPGMNDPDKPLTQASSDSTTVETRDFYGYTDDENTIYTKIKEEVMKYFLHVTKEVQENIDNHRNKTIQNAKFEAWLKAKTSGPDSKKQPGKKRKRQYSHDNTGKKSRKTEQQQKVQKGPPKNRPRPRTSNKKGRNGKGNRGEKNNAGRDGSTARRR